MPKGVASAHLTCAVETVPNAATDGGFPVGVRELSKSALVTTADTGVVSSPMKTANRAEKPLLNVPTLNGVGTLGARTVESVSFPSRVFVKLCKKPSRENKTMAQRSPHLGR